MAAEWVEVLGYAAGLVVNGATAPQTMKTIRKRTARALSWSYVSAYVGGMIAGCVYSVAIQVGPIVFANAIGLVFSAALMAAKVHGHLTDDGDKPAPESDPPGDRARGDRGITRRS